ncbi:MAG: hypothetical protein H0V51_06030 [Chloroflexi bacterium]|nr:hypothetical protein [Chloroflexota bacterium]
MQRFSDQVEERTLELAWSLWVEVGVSGWTRRHAASAIDPEPLILFTAALRDLDPRLRDESTDWCIRYGRYVSAARLRNLLRSEPPKVQSAFGEYAATVNAHAGVRWPGATQPRPYRPTGRSRIEDFTRPALIVLRLRALFGVGARAELIRSFLAHPDAAPSAADLAGEVSYTKRNVADELESLRMAGLLRVTPARNQLRYRLARPRELWAFGGRRPSRFPRWSATFRLLCAMLDLARRADALDPAVRAVEARRALRHLSAELEQAGFEPPSAEATGLASWCDFEQWALDLTASLASGDLSVPRTAWSNSPDSSPGGAAPPGTAGLPAEGEASLAPTAGAGREARGPRE